MAALPRAGLGSPKRCQGVPRRGPCCEIGLSWSDMRQIGSRDRHTEIARSWLRNRVERSDMRQIGSRDRHTGIARSLPRNRVERSDMRQIGSRQRRTEIARSLPRNRVERSDMRHDLVAPSAPRRLWLEPSARQTSSGSSPPSAVDAGKAHAGKQRQRQCGLGCLGRCFLRHGRLLRPSAPAGGGALFRGGLCALVGRWPEAGYGTALGLPWGALVFSLGSMR